MAEINTLTTPDGPINFPVIEFTSDEANFFTEEFGGEKATSFLAREAISEITQNPKLGNLFTYETLKDGTAPLFDFDPELVGKSSKEKSLSDEEILKEFTNLEDTGFFTGFGREIFKTAPSAAGFVGGAKIGGKLQQMIPPLGPVAIGVKFAIPVTTGVLGAFGAYEMGDDVSEFVLGQEGIIIPSHKASYEAGRTTAGGLAWLPTPFMISKNISFGAANYIKNLDEILKTGQQQIGLQRSKPPITTKLISGVETLLNKTGKEFRDKPKRMAALEGLSVGGATTGAYFAENLDPGGVAARIGFEMTGAIAPQLAFGTVVRNFGEILSSLKKPFTKEGRKDLFDKSGISVTKRRLQAVGRIKKILEDNGDDVEALIKELSDDSITNQLYDESGQLIKLTAGQKSGNPTLMAIEASLASSSQGLGKTRKENHILANKALRNLIGALVLQGDKSSLKQAALIRKSQFDGYLVEKLALRSDQVIDAFKKLSGDNPINNKKLSEKLFEITGSALQQARTEESRLYKNIGNLEITSFIGPDGQAINTPNFISYLKNNLPQTQEALSETLKDLGPLYAFYQRKGKELGLPEFVEEATGRAGKAVDLSKFDQNIDKIIEKGALAKGNSVLNEVNRTLRYLKLPEIDDVSKLKDVTTFNRDQLLDIQEYFVSKTNFPKRYGTTKDELAVRAFERDKRNYTAAKNVFNNLLKKSDASPTATATTEGGDLQPLTVTEIRDMRSLALEKGRELKAAGKPNASRIAFGFAEALLDDLNSAPEGVNVAFDNARAFSKSLNDVYTRAFAGNILAKSKSGAEKLAPELLHTKLFVGGADPTYFRVQQIQDIGLFAKEQGLEGADDLISTVHGTLDGILRNARAEAFDPETGTINIKKLQDWNRKNAELLEQFPSLKTDLEDAEKANVLLNNWVNKEKNIQKSIKQQKTYRNITGVENPTLAVIEAVNSKFPTKALNSMIKAAKDNPEALGGLKSAILEAALTKGGGTSDTFSPRAVYQNLFTKIPNALDRRTTLMNVMLKNKVITEPEANNFKKLLTEMVKLEAAEGIGQIDDVIERTGAIVDFYLRITGSAIGTRLQSTVFGGQGPGSLVAAGAGSKALRNLFNSIPESMKTDVMTEVMENPSLLATLLRKATTEEQKLNIASKLKKILGKAGYLILSPVVKRPVEAGFRATPAIIRETQEEEIDMTDPVFDVKEQSSVQPNQQGSPTTQIGQGLSSGVNNRLAANVGTTPPAASIDRTKFASLFPDDITSGLINAQQPVRFMQFGGDVDAGLGGDEDDYISDAYSQSDFNQFDSQDNIDFGNYADETSAMQAAQGIVGLAGQTRSNIRDSVNYDPIYAQALNITRGILPGNDVRGDYFGAEKFQGIENLTRPPSLTPQVPGRFDSEADMVRPMFFSGAERFLVQDAPKLVEQGMNMGIMGLARKAGDYFSSNFSKLFGGGEEVTPQKVKAQDKDITADDIIGNPKYSINIRRLAGEPLSDILKSRSR